MIGNKYVRERDMIPFYMILILLYTARIIYYSYYVLGVLLKILFSINAYLFYTQNNKQIKYHIVQDLHTKRFNPFVKYINFDIYTNSHGVHEF